MTHYIDLLSIITPQHLRQGYENRTRFDCGDFEINIFETFQSTTKAQIKFDGLSISGMIRGQKIVYNTDGKAVDFLPGTSLILPIGKLSMLTSLVRRRPILNSVLRFLFQNKHLLNK